VWTSDFIFGLLVIQICYLSVFNILPKAVILTFLSNLINLGFGRLKIFVFFVPEQQKVCRNVV